MKKILQILLPLISLLSVLASCGGKTPTETTATTRSTTAGTEVQSTSSSSDLSESAATSNSSENTEYMTATTTVQTTAEQTSVQTTAATTEPPINYVYVNGADEISLKEVASMLTADDIEMSAQMGYVTHIGDIYAGQDGWTEFLELVEEGKPAVVRIAYFYRFDGGLEGTDKSVTFADLTYNGKLFFYDKCLEGGEIRSRTYAFLCYDKVIADHSQEYHPEYTEMEVYILSNHENATYADYEAYIFSASFGGTVVDVVYKDCVYPEEQ